MKIHVVKPGETLWRISQGYRTDINQIILLNELDDPNVLVVGQSLVIPEINREYVVQSGDNFWAISSRYGLTVQELAGYNNISNPALIFVGQMLQMPYMSHTIQPGEALWSIASRYGVTEEKLYYILEIYMKLFPVKNSSLFRYSHLGFLGEGIISLYPDELVHIRDIRDDIRSLPIIYSALYERRAKYWTGIEYLKQINSKYITPSKVNSFLVIPICFSSVAIGYICTTEFEKGMIMTDLLH